MLERIIGWFKKRAQNRPSIVFGRYSDNNKTVVQVSRWTAADTLFREKKYSQSIDAFFDYLRDDSVKNVETIRSGQQLHFTLYQGSKVVRGVCDDQRLKAEVVLARMPEPSIPVMRRLLEQNYLLYYSRYTLDQDRICMRFDSEIETANPNKLYYGLKELATKADKQDDLLVQDFAMLEQIDMEHVGSLTEDETRTRLFYFRSFIRETLERVEKLDKEKMAGGISYMLLALGYRIDYLVSPEGRLLQELEKIINIYFSKEERSAQEKNHLMVEAFKKLNEKQDGEILTYLFRSVSTFSIVSPQPHKVIVDVLNSALQNMQWYRDNKYPETAQQIMEYGFSYCQYSYSLPKPLSQLFQLYMEVFYPEYFYELGFKEKLFDAQTGVFRKEIIELAIEDINQTWKEKYPMFLFKTQQLKYENLTSFGQSFLKEIIALNFDVVK